VKTLACSSAVAASTVAAIFFDSQRSPALADHAASFSIAAVLLESTTGC
jgi:hypothetical protein